MSVQQIPTMNVPTEYKSQMLTAMVPTVVMTLSGGAQGGEATADDIIDFFAMAIASVLDNDSYLTTPRHLRIGAETAAKHIERRAREFRAMQTAMGSSWFSLAMDQAERMESMVQ